MNRKLSIYLVLTGALLSLLIVSIAGAQNPGPQGGNAAQADVGTGFTYQGHLQNGGAPVNNVCDLQFSLWDTAGSGVQIGATQTASAISVTNGLFTVQLDFGDSAFAGQARWLEIAVRCPTASGSYTILSPRQELSAAPYALYALGAPWSGLHGVPPGFADGVDDVAAVVSGTHIFAGDGLTLASNGDTVTLSVFYAGSGGDYGAAVSAARSDHAHDGRYYTQGQLNAAGGGGQVHWDNLTGVPGDLGDGDDDTRYSAGTGLSLLVDTVFSLSPTYRLPQTCANGQIAEWNDAAGLWECGADDGDGGGNDHDHLGQTWTGSDNSLVISGTFGAPDYAALVLGNTHASGDGLRVGSAGWDGVNVGSAGDDGVYVYSAGDDGVNVGYASDDGVRVHRAGNPSTATDSDYHNGFEVAGAEGYGLYIGRSDQSAVMVNDANTNGFFVDTAGNFGLYVRSAGYDGVRVMSAGWNGVHATSASNWNYGGHFENSAAGGGGLYARGGSSSAPDIVLGGSANYDSRIYSDPDYASSDIHLVSNDAIRLDLDSDDDESGNLWILNGAGDTVFSVNESGNMTAIGTKSATVSTQDYGQRQLYAVESPEVWFEDFGAAQLVNGQATVSLEPMFAQTVNLSETYHVFLTPLGDCPLYVAEKTVQSFTVQAMGGRACSIAFDYRIVARRLGYERVRLEVASLDAAEESDK
jgi:hypothetical protein